MAVHLKKNFNLSYSRPYPRATCRHQRIISTILDVVKHTLLKISVEHLSFLWVIAYPLIPSRESNDQIIMQSDWSRSFWSYNFRV